MARDPANDPRDDEPATHHRHYWQTLPRSPRNMFFKLWPWILACRLVLSLAWDGFLFFGLHISDAPPQKPPIRWIIHIIVAVLFLFFLFSYQRCLYI